MTCINITERKVRHNGTIAEYTCRVVDRNERQLVLLYEIPQNFSIEVNNRVIHIPAGTVTVGFYWEDRPYNVYHWRTKDGKYLGSYFNIVKNTSITEGLVTYVDLIVDVMVLPDGSHAVLDLDELPQPLHLFENGDVERHLQKLLRQKHAIVNELMQATDQFIEQRRITEIK